MIESMKVLIVVCIIFAAVFASGLVLIIWLGHRSKYRRAAKRILKQIDSLPPEQLSATLSTVHHFVFEELVLLQLKRKGAKVLQNRRYTNDGGIDGRYRYGKQKRWNLIQTKRYALNQHAAASDVAKLSAQCTRTCVDGLFITTGRMSAQLKRKYGEQLHLVDRDNVAFFFRSHEMRKKR